MPTKTPQTLIQELLRLNLISENDVSLLENISQKEGKDFERLLIERGLISDSDLLKIKSDLYHFPSMNMEGVELSKDAFKTIQENMVSFYKIVPLSKEEDLLRVGIINPEDIEALEALKFIAEDKGLTVEKYLVNYKDFDNILRNYRTLTGEVGKALEAFEKEGGQDEGEAIKSIEDITAEAPVTKIVAVIIKHAVESRASDIHIEPFEDGIRIRFRIDGLLTVALILPKNLQSAIATRIKILTDLKIDETRLAQDGRFSTKIGGRKIDFRVSTFPTKNGEKVVMRILDPISMIELAELGLTGQSAETLDRALAKPFGSILITGPTGSGKSTTLMGILKKINSDDVNIVTLEDPIEYFIDGINQSQIHEEIGYTFANGLRHILRQDPNVIMVGEIRDKETASLATQASLTGHIVLSTIHTNDAIGVIPRLIDMGVEKYLIPSTLNMIAAQRLLRRLCEDCKLKTKANTAEEGLITTAINSMPNEYQKELLSKNGYTVHKPNIENPCKKCGGKAFKGRIAVFETLEMTNELEKIILGNLSDTALHAEAQRQGMITMFQDGILKALRGIVSLEELLEVTSAGDNMQ